MKLLDVYVVVNGRMLGPFVATAPVNDRGDTLEPKTGDEVMILIRPRGEPPVDRGHVWARTKFTQ